MFTRIGTIIAWLGLVLGGIRLAAAIFIATMNDPERIALTARYLGSKTTGQVIDQTVVVVVLAVAIGILAEISRSVRRPE